MRETPESDNSTPRKPYVPNDQEKFDEMKAAFAALPLGMQRVHLNGEFIKPVKEGGKGYHPKDAMNAYDQSRATAPEPPKVEPVQKPSKPLDPPMTLGEMLREAIPSLKNVPGYDKL